MNELDEIVTEFVIESYEGLDVLERELLALEQDPSSPESLATIFRSIHSIKGACGFLGFSVLERVAHAGENLLSRLRDGTLVFTPEMASALLDLSDTIRAMLATIEATGADGSDEHTALLATLADLNEGRPPAAPAPTAAPASEPPSPVAESTDLGEPAPASPARPHPPDAGPSGPAPPAPGTDGPVSGPSGSVVISDSDTEAAPAAEVPATTAEPEPSPEPEAEPAPEPAAEPEPVPPAPEPEPEPAAVAPARAEPAPRAEIPERRASDKSAIRVDVGVLNNLMTLVGELVLARNELVQLVSDQQDGLLVAAAQRLSLITTELQEGAMKTRMQPIGTVTAKLPRIVRELARTSGKSVRLVVDGEDTELDKSIIEAISDPLTHLVRNAVDHGVEDPQTRVAVGKPPEAVLAIRAYHEGGKVNIEIADDGAGVDLDRVRAKAVEKMIAPPDAVAAMTDREVLDLIFMPGFSTAATITNVSGRGVGMDVVRSNIERIGGSVEVHSSRGKGTVFKVKIPLTLAIVPALFVDSAGERFAIPQINVLELVRLAPDQADNRIESIHGAPVYRLRGRLLPLLYLRRELAQPEPDLTGTPQPINIVVLQIDERQFGMVVERVSDSAEIVVKPLGSHLKSIPTYAGATIMGDGQVALILDVMGVAARADLLSDATTRAITEAVITRPEGTSDLESLLLLSTGDGGRLAIPLGAVDRLEKFNLDMVESVGDRDVVQYRDMLLPLVRINEVLIDRRSGGRYGEEERPDSALHVVVHRHGERRVGLVVERILDVVEHVMSLEPATRPGVIGTMVIEGRATEVLDVEAVVELAGAAL
jgi:two-component system, chemotaxis family, sensor kinase CheA